MLADEARDDDIEVVVVRGRKCEREELMKPQEAEGLVVFLTKIFVLADFFD